MWTSQHLNTQHLRWCFIMELHEDIFSLREWQNPLKCFVHGEILALIPEMHSINLLNGLVTACTWERGGTLRVSTGRPQSRGWVPVWQRESKKEDSSRQQQPCCCTLEHNMSVKPPTPAGGHDASIWEAVKVSLHPPDTSPAPLHAAREAGYRLNCGCSVHEEVWWWWWWGGCWLMMLGGRERYSGAAGILLTLG